MNNDDLISQEQIEKMLSDSGQVRNGSALAVDDYLTRDEQDVLGEVGNICMGTAATTMYTLLGKKVTITTPAVSLHTLKSLSDEYPAPIVVVEVNYTQGLMGKNLLILKDHDVALITNFLLGEEDDIDPDNVTLDETHLSAIREVMNQMVGSSATSLADILKTPINISTPEAKMIQLENEDILNAFADHDDPIVKINFKMEIEDMLTSEIMQILPLKFSKTMAARVVGAVDQPEEDKMEKGPVDAAHPEPVQNKDVDVRMARLPAFDSMRPEDGGSLLKNIDMIQDVPMKVTVELGKAKKKIKDILDFNTGFVIVLDKIAGEAVDILVNGKNVGKGEVVVIDDNYGVRITEINLPTAKLV